MGRAFKLFAIVTFFVFTASVPAWGYEHQGFKNRAFERLKKQVWYSGIDGSPSRENVFEMSEKLRESFRSPEKGNTERDWKKRYPEELVFPLLQVTYLD